MLINLSNHASSSWSSKQLITAKTEYNQIIDLDFPNIDPLSDENNINILADEYLDKCLRLLRNKTNQNNAVHIMGEHTFVAKLISKLIKNGIKCIASTTERISTIEENKKITEFKFTKFREYSL